VTLVYRENLVEREKLVLCTPQDSQTTLTFIKDGVLPTHSYAPLIDKIFPIC